ncbi:hypothetical protein AVEN_62988-1 [Araneus ventricosus]|uniref:Uncharacterized protein n=1 Tax=Araneus ventricosus TaxID=182803 RepID=A0A4Y2CQK8_ARAVE|nr:hypothetical protein AVEN_62988-1 [Araneus ventricosus]
MNTVSIPGSEELEVLSPSCIEIVQVLPLVWCERLEKVCQLRRRPRDLTAAQNSDVCPKIARTDVNITKTNPAEMSSSSSDQGSKSIPKYKMGH